jgi:hypothetical protein
MICMLTHKRPYQYIGYLQINYTSHMHRNISACTPQRLTDVCNGQRIVPSLKGHHSLPLRIRLRGTGIQGNFVFFLL